MSTPPGGDGLLNDRFRCLRLLKRGQGVDTWLGRDETEGRAVVIKTVDAASVPAAARLRLEHEADVLRRLASGPSGTPRLLVDLGRDGDILYLVQPFVDGITLRDRLHARGPLSPAVALRVASDILSTLQLAHGHGVLHRDIKPANVIVSDCDPIERAVLIDFGLARSAGLDPAVRDEPVGTARYLAPEAAGLLDVAVDERSDLYSVGVVLFECLAGRPPFEGTDVGEVLRQHLNTAAPQLRGLGVAVPRALDAIVQRLLRKDPGERYQSADAVLADLAALAGGLAAGVDDPAITIGLHDRRHSLTEPAFVGRGAELAALGDLCDRAWEGRGGLVLLEAESGGGKTRLLDELALQAMERGAWILRGQGVDQAAQRPFQLLDGVAAGLGPALERDPALTLEVASRLGDRIDAVVAALPALAHPFGRQGPADVGPETFGENRSLDGLRQLLTSLGSARRPALVILDDCQWSDGLTTTLLSRWNDAAHTASADDEPVHVVVVAAFRSEEVGAGHALRGFTPAAHLILEPFGSAEVAQLCESMAGPLPREAVATVTQLAEGSPFMASAVLRGLVESGALHDSPVGWAVDRALLADVQTSRRAALFLVRRLELLAPDSLLLLSVAAVLGKEFELALAIDLANATATQAAATLDEARRRRILWVDERHDRCSFTHDKLREALLARMPQDDLLLLHLQAARRIEAADPSRVFELAYHFDAAGQGERALGYALAAAELSRSRHALDAAVVHYRIAERAVELAGDDSEVATPAVRRRIAEGMGDVLSLQGNYDAATTELERALAGTDEPVDRATLEAKLGDIAFKRGQPADARRYLEGALTQLGRRVPRSGVAWVTAVLWEVLVQMAHTALPRLWVGRRSSAGREREFLAVRIYSRLAYVYWFHAGKVACGWAHLREMNQAERYPPTAELAQAYSEHAPVATIIPWYGRGEAYVKRSLAIRRRLGDVWGEGQSLGFYGAVLYSASRFAEAMDRCREAMRLLERTGDKWEENTAVWHVAYCHYRMGDLTRAVETARRLHASAREIGDDTAAGISLAVWSKASGGRVPADLVAAELARDNEDAHTSVEVHLAEGIRLLASGEEHDLDAALDVIRTAYGIVRKGGLRQEYIAPVYPWLATVLRMRAERLPPYTSGAARRVALTEARRAAAKATRVARSYRNNAPHAWRERGLVAALGGRTRAAARALNRSLAIATDQSMAYEAALTRLALARLTGSDEAVAVAASEVGEFEAAAFDGGGNLGVAAELSLADRFSTLLQVGRHIASASSPDAVYTAVREGALALLRGERCHVIEVSDDLEERLTTESGEPVDELSHALIVEALRVRAPLALSDVGSADADDSDERLLAAGLRSVLCAPIEIDDRVVACFYMTHQQVGGLFGDDEIQLASFIATLGGAALEHLAGTEARFRSLAQNSSDVITIVDQAGTIVYQSSAIERVFGFEAADLVGQPLSNWVHPEDADLLLSYLNLTAAGRGTLIECRLRHHDGSWRHVETALNNLLGDPSVNGLVLNTRDISERVALEFELRNRAWHDSLTGLANRALFSDRVNHALARQAREAGTFAVLFLDLDDFKSINDSLGHAAGDLLLQGVGARLERCVRPGDTVARFGGDEFAVLLEHATQEDAERVAGRIMSQLAQPFSVAGHELHARASLGLTMADGTDGCDDLLASADAAMYVAKARGKGRYEMFEATMRAAALERSGLRTDLEWALPRNELRMHYQPVIDVGTGGLEGFEALLRWEHPERGLLSPTDFISLAEESGLIVPIGTWALRAVCHQAQAWKSSSPGTPSFSMAVNVSARQLGHPSLVADVAEVLAESGLEPSSLILEITESATVQDAEAVIARLVELKELGVGLAIDDFGTGYSSLSYLRRFPVDLLKVDRSFVAGLGRDEEDTAIVASVVGLAHALGLKAVAEGVETVDQLEQLNSLGCDLAQGYNWRRPSDVVSTGEWLAQLAATPLPAGSPGPGGGAPVRVVLADDRGGVRAAIRLAMEIDGRFEVVGEAEDGEQAVAVVQATAPDLVVLDLSMPGVGGVEALPAIRRAAPSASIVLLTAMDPDDIPETALRDALGFFDKTVDLSSLVDKLGALVIDR